MTISRARRCFATGLMLAAAVCASGPGPGSGWHKVTFDDAPEGKVAPGFTPIVGRWVVVALPEGGKALAQAAENPDDVFNLVFRRSRIRNVDMTVRFRAVAGKNDQGGGLVWRATRNDPEDGLSVRPPGASNYYLARYNPLEENFRVYKVVDGKRTQLQSANVKRTEGWHTLRVWMFRDHIWCDLDNRTILHVTDSTFHDLAAGIGLWTKSDAQTQFDDLEYLAFE